MKKKKKTQSTPVYLNRYGMGEVVDIWTLT